MGNSPLSSIESLSEIKAQLTNKSFLRLADICIWDRDGSWVGWTFPVLPNHLISQKNLLILSLSGITPVNYFYKYSWGWGRTGKYSTAQGFSTLQSPLASS